MEVKIGEIVLRLRVTGFGSLAIPMGGRAMILSDPETVIVHVAKIYFGGGIACLGAFFKETKCFGIILPNAAALEVKDA